MESILRALVDGGVEIPDRSSPAAKTPFSYR